MYYLKYKECRECGTLWPKDIHRDDCLSCGAELFDSEYYDGMNGMNLTEYEGQVLYPKYIYGNKQRERKYRKAHKRGNSSVENLCYFSAVAMWPCGILTALAVNYLEDSPLVIILILLTLFFSIVGVTGMIVSVAGDLSTPQGRHKAWKETKESVGTALALWALSSFFGSHKK